MYFDDLVVPPKLAVLLLCTKGHSIPNLQSIKLLGKYKVSSVLLQNKRAQEFPAQRERDGKKERDKERDGERKREREGDGDR